MAGSPDPLYSLTSYLNKLPLEKGVNVKKVSEMLGHSNIAITLATYSHVTKQMDREAVNRMEAMLTNAGF